MFTFAYPGVLFLLLLIPIFTVLYIISRIVRKRRIKKFGNPKTLHGLMPNYSPYKSNIRFIVAMIALTSIIFAFARPWGGVQNQETSREGIEIVIAVDASNSMLASATAEENGPDRMGFAKLMLDKLIDRLSNDRIGLIAYAGEAYTLIPVTNDYVSAKAFLTSLDPSLIRNQGTNIEEAINLAERSFGSKDDVGKAIILLTDAEELGSEDEAIKAVKQAAKRGIQTDVIGIGSSPVTIPSKEHGRMLDDEGNVIKTALNEDMALEIAKAGKGIYVNASNDDAIDELVKQLGNLKKAALEASFLVTHDELYFPFVILAIVMLIIDFILTDKRNKWLDKINFFTKDKAVILCLVTLGIGLASCNNRSEQESSEQEESFDSESRRDSLLSVFSLPKERDLITAGNAAHLSGNLEAADSSYMAALKENNRSVVASYNKGVNSISMFNALMQNTPEGEKVDSTAAMALITQASDAFQAASAPKVAKGNVSSFAFYNLGNLAFTNKNFSNAIEMYKEALRLNPNDDNARKNLRIAQLQKQQQDQQQQQQDEQDQQKDQQQDKDQQQQNPNQNRQQINPQTSEQILNAAERKENERRMRIQERSSSGNHRTGW